MKTFHIEYLTANHCLAIIQADSISTVVGDGVVAVSFHDNSDPLCVRTLAVAALQPGMVVIEQRIKPLPGEGRVNSLEVFV